VRLFRAGKLPIKSLLATVGLMGILLASVAPSASAATVPFTDPAAIGQLSFCNSAHQSITSGSLGAKPFVAYAVGSTTAPNGYTGSGRTAVLFAASPKQDLNANQWPGEYLTSTAVYGNPQHPTAAGTSADLSMQNFFDDAKPLWDGLVELRLYVGAPLQAFYTQSYDAATIKISGNSWKLIQGGSAPCADSDSTPREDALPKGTTGAQEASLAAKPSAANSSAGSTSAAGGVAGQSASSADSAAPDTVSAVLAAGSPRGGSGGVGAGLVIALVVGVAALLSASGYGVFWLRRRPRPHAGT
jgi:hypothetical protein